MLARRVLAFPGSFRRTVTRSAFAIEFPYRQVEQHLAVLALAVSGIGCGDSLAPGEVLSVAIAPADTTAFAGDSITFEAFVEHRSGLGSPDTVLWSVSDPGVLSLSQEPGGRASVTAQKRGEAYLIALINAEFVDSSHVTVVQPGDVRWRLKDEARLLAASGPALDGLGRVYVSHIGNGEQELLSAFTTNGESVFSVPSCVSRLSPSISDNGHAYTTGISCTQGHGPDGTAEWGEPFGTFDGGLAVAADGSIALLHMHDGAGGRAAVVSRISAQGVELWRNTVGYTLEPQASAPGIALNGDIYVAWAEDFSGPNWLTRLASDGREIWTVPGYGYTYGASPALVGDRVVTTGRFGGLAVYDTSGARLWSRTWTGTAGGVSSPVIDGEGNIYVQSPLSLVSYDANGLLRWSADSLGCPACGYGVGGPTLLSNREVLVTCRVPGLPGSELCAVNGADGSLVWRSETGGDVYGCPAVTPDGTIFVGATQGLLALWARVPPLTEGWPTEGGSMLRQRQRK